MSFVDPLWLLALLLIPAGGGAAVWGRRRSGRYAMRFTAVAGLREAMAAVPGWQRHVPAALMLAAAGLLAVALARPRIHERSAVGSAAIMLVSDHSGSMAATDVSPTRLGRGSVGR